MHYNDAKGYHQIMTTIFAGIVAAALIFFWIAVGIVKPTAKAILQFQLLQLKGGFYWGVAIMPGSTVFVGSNH